MRTSIDTVEGSGVTGLGWDTDVESIEGPEGFGSRLGRRRYYRRV